MLVVAYNAAATLAQTLSRLPQSFIETVDHVLVCDDASSDDTYEVGLRFKTGSSLPLTVVRHEKNLGYGGNQKAGYAWAIAHGLDIVVLLHGDGQYAPEHIEDLVAPLASGEADAVFGSRMMTRGAARQGGMPLYKFVGNRILTRFQNGVAGLDLTEWHSGYRAYRVDALADLDLASYVDGFNFDTEIILGLAAQGKRIVEVPIPTYYGDEICYVNGMKYAKDVSLDVVRYRMRRMGFGEADDRARHRGLRAQAVRALLPRRAAAVAAVRAAGARCSTSAAPTASSRRSPAPTATPSPGSTWSSTRASRTGCRRFVEADLNRGLPEEAGSDYRVVVAGDVLEHVVDPQQLLTDIAGRLADDGEVFVSVPNFAHWYPRAKVVSGRFDYDQRGPLDHGHVRFFTRRSFERLIEQCGLRIVERQHRRVALRRRGPRRRRRPGRPGRRAGGGGRPRRDPDVADPVRLPVPVPAGAGLNDGPRPDRLRRGIATGAGTHGGSGGLLPDAVQLHHQRHPHRHGDRLRLELLRPAGPGVPGRPDLGAPRFARHRGLRAPRPGVHVLPAVPGAAAASRCSSPPTSTTAA